MKRLKLKMRFPFEDKPRKRLTSGATIMKPSVYSTNDKKGILLKNKFDVKQILREISGEDSLELVYETPTTCDISYAGTVLLAKQMNIATEVVQVKKMSRFVGVARATNPITRIRQVGAASYPITIMYSDEVIKLIVERLAKRNACLKVIPETFVKAFVHSQLMLKE